MAKHRMQGSAVFPRARHRGPGRVRRAADRAARGTITTLAAMALVVVMFGSDPALNARN